MPYANALDGTRLYYEELGQGEPLLLVSGQANNHKSWDLVRNDFAGRYHVIVFDHRGTGKSDKPSEPPYSTRGFARDAISILDHLQIPRAHAYGVSMGGRICQWLGVDYADRIGALVLGCTTPGNAHGVRRPPDVDATMANSSDDPQAAIKAMLSAMFSPEWIAANSQLIEQMLQEPPIPAYAQKLHYLASEGHDTWDLLPSISAPTLVIHGSDDPVNPTANAYLLADRIPGAQLYIVAGGRHGYFVEFREEASRVVLDFLASNPLQ
jgi:pimeloyl-ACP methyl ester carboxylesterase